MTKRLRGPPRPKFHQRRRERAEFKARKESIPLSPLRALYMATNRKEQLRQPGETQDRPVVGWRRSRRPLTQPQFDAIRPGLQQQAIELGLAPAPPGLDKIW
jgi:hypothetical protein